jgi:hypothetical protein
MSDDGKVPLPNLEDRAVQPDMPIASEPDGPTARVAGDLEAVFDVPVQVSAVLGRARMEINDLLKIGPGTVLELDRKVSDRHLCQQPPGRPRRGCSGRRETRRDHDGNHQGGAWLMELGKRIANSEWRIAARTSRNARRQFAIDYSLFGVRHPRPAIEKGTGTCGS